MAIKAPKLFLYKQIHNHVINTKYKLKQKVSSRRAANDRPYRGNRSSVPKNNGRCNLTSRADYCKNKKSHCIKIQWDRNILRYHPNWRQASALSNRHIDYISLTQKYAVLNHTELRGSAPKLYIKALHQNGFLSEMLTSRLIPSQPNIVIQL